MYNYENVLKFISSDFLKISHRNDIKLDNELMVDIVDEISKIIDNKGLDFNNYSLMGTQTVLLGINTKDMGIDSVNSMVNQIENNSKLELEFDYNGEKLWVHIPIVEKVI